MAIHNIPAGNGIILSGNRQLAATFVKISKRRLWEMRQLMIMSKRTMMQRSFYFDRNCVWVRMHIIGNAEFIRIHACAEGAKGACHFATINPETTIVSEYQLTCPEEGVDDPKLIKFDDVHSVEFDATRTNRWIWGEGPPDNPDSGNDHTEHIYTDSQIEYLSSQQQWDITTATKTYSPERKEATGATQAEAHANFLATPWISGGGSTLLYHLKDNSVPPNRWTYSARRDTVTYDLGVGTTYPLDIRNTASVYYSLTSPGTPHSTGLRSSLGGTITVDGSSVEIEDMASNIGTNDLEVVYDDISDYAALPTIAVGGESGWFATKQLSPGGDNIYITRKTIKFISVEGGKWKISQSGPSIHERLESVE
jgi:hypothetical protein